MFHREHNVARFLACFNIPGSLDDLLQGVRSINNWLVFTCLNKLFEKYHVFLKALWSPKILIIESEDVVTTLKNITSVPTASIFPARNPVGDAFSAD